MPDGQQTGPLHNRELPLAVRLLPLSETRRDIDWMFANERRCETFEEVIEEARAMRATGAGIPVATPMARERTLEDIPVEVRVRSRLPSSHVHKHSIQSRTG